MTISLGILLIEALIPFMRTLPSWPNYFQWPHLLVPSSWAFGFQHKNFGGTQTFCIKKDLSNLIIRPSTRKHSDEGWRRNFFVVEKWVVWNTWLLGKQPKLFKAKFPCSIFPNKNIWSLWKQNRKFTANMWHYSLSAIEELRECSGLAAGFLSASHLLLGWQD